jgi:hypothetical protein
VAPRRFADDVKAERRERPGIREAAALVPQRLTLGDVLRRRVVGSDHVAILVELDPRQRTRRLDRKWLRR